MKQTLFAVAAVVCAVTLLAQEPPKPESPKADAPKAQPPKPEPPKEKPFAEVIKDAQQISGLFTFYRTEEKLYLELGPEHLEKIYLLSMTCDSGLGERGFYAAAMCGEAPFVFHKQGKNIQFVIKNPRFTAERGSPMERAVARSFSESLIGASRIESLPHPDRKSFLIDAGPVLLADVPMMSFELERTFRLPYRFDGRNSSFGTVKAFPKNVEVETIAHYGAERPPLPPLLPPGAPQPPSIPPPRTLSDIRSLFMRFRYSISELPGEGYRARLADDRVGYFLDQVGDFSTDVKYSPTVRYITRWRLEKSDPSAALSRPKKPIVFWLENTIPVKYRDALRDGVLMWNKAFERIGFKDAVEVHQQPDDADWDPGDVRYSTIRWFTAIDAGFAQGPSRSNPFTGEIYDADIRFSEAITRFRRREIAEEANPLSALNDDQAYVYRTPWSTARQAFCNYQSAAAEDMSFAMDVLEARGIEPDSPEADKIVSAFLREIAAHEVGHTLGLRHNFRASTIRTIEQAQDANLTAGQGLTGSVMDYIPTNLAAKGAKQGEYHQSTLGPYDYWAIEYGYKTIEASSPEGERAELSKIATRVAEPALAYATDEDAGFGPAPFDMDPLANRFDMGPDPLRFARHRVRLSREVLANIETALEKPGEGYQLLRRSFTGSMLQIGGAMRIASRYVGGVYHHRDHIGDPNGRLPFQPVPAAKQREALALIRETLFDPSAFRFSPRLLNKLNNERLPDMLNFAALQSRFDVPVHDMVLSLQRVVLDRLCHPLLLARVLDSEVKVAAAAEQFRISDLFTGLQDSIWAETKTPGASLDITTYRRSLQRDHMRRMIAMVVRDASAPEDARTMARWTLQSLRDQLNGTLNNAAVKMPVETRAHLTESVARIDEALRGGIMRTAF